MRSLRPLVAALTLAVALIVADAAAQAQGSQPATVIRVIDGRSLDARLADGREVGVRLVGIDVPAPPDECGSPDATDALRAVVEGQAVNLVSDPYEAQLDAEGRSFYYVDRASDGIDSGQELVRAGWA
jgi:endonuclease YncB( thermonuclease family)